jgi:acyl transferase domain-containing protein/acyl carrier protein
MSEQSDNGTGHEFDIAIVGLAARFPKSRSAEEFWKNLNAGVECISFFSKEEMMQHGANAEMLSRPGLVRAAALLDDIDLFDAEFFGYSPGEAQTIDPQHRLFLESAWEALEDAGYVASKFPGLIGVYAGTGFNSYLMRLLSSGSLPASADGMQITLGNDKDYLTTRISYKLNLRGPSVCVQTACSTSLAAVHLACQGLIEHECDMALAGGVSVRCPQPMFYHYQQGSILSPDGHCRTFDARAEGTVFGNGLGIVVLKRYEEALRDGDHIYALIRGSAMNNDGSLKVGYTAPSVEGQTQVITRALAAAGIEADSISYVETHGTGTRLGDPIEITALKQALGRGKHRGSCILGSVKTNIGHLDTAAGIAGLIKTTLALKNKTIPPTLHFDTANPELHLEDSPFRIQQQSSHWHAGSHPRRAGVSSFGIGGTNVHVVLEEAPEQRQHESRRQCQLLTLSARTQPALDEMCGRLASHLRSSTGSLADVAYTTQVGRETFLYRRAVVAGSVDEASELLQSERLPPVQPVNPSIKPSVVFMFPGQGDQHVNMAKSIYKTEPVFRDCVDQCSNLLRRHVGRDIRELLYPAAQQEDSAGNELEQTAWTQPALFVIEYALARLWMEWGIQPAAMIGHSLGEFVAACLAEVFSVEDALALVAERGRLMQQMARGSMLAVALPESELQALPLSVSLAAVNAPHLCVLAGPTDAIQNLKLRFETQKISCRVLRTSHAYHSMMMEGVVTPFQRAVERVKLSPPKLPYVSCVTGQWIRAEQAVSPAYWAEQMRRSVRFSNGLCAAASMPNAVLLEVGPRRSLCKIVQQHRFSNVYGAPLATLSDLENDGKTDNQSLLATLGELWMRNGDIQWGRYYAGEQRRRVSLPAYPFQRRRFWFDDSPAVSATENLRPALAQSGTKQSAYYRPSWKLSAPARLAPDAAIIHAEGTWLVIEDACGLTAAVIEQLQRSKQHVITVKAGRQFECKDESTFTVVPGSDDDMKQLFTMLREHGRFPHTIVHCALMSPEPASAPPFDSDKRLYADFEVLMRLAAEAGSFCQSPLRLFVICDQLHSITGEEVIDPLKSSVLGICRVAPLEIPDLACSCIDVVVPKSSSEFQPLAGLLVEEMSHESTSTVVAYRRGRRWELSFDPLIMSDDITHTPVFRERGVYLITGGLGGLGAEIALLLARKFRARLALIGRTALPSRMQWPTWLQEHGDDDPISRKIIKIQAMEDAGAEVLALAADVTSREQMEAAVLTIRSTFGDIHGALHLAGVPGGGLLQTRTRAAALQVLAPKIQGTLILDEVLRDQKCDFIALFSSTLGVTGAIGQSDYCAANAFLDAFAHSRVEPSATPVIAVDWDGWKLDSWQQQIRSTMPELYQELREKRERFGIGLEEGFEMLQQALRASLPQIVVSRQDFAAVASRRPARFNRAGGRQAVRDTAHDDNRKDGLFVAPRNHTEEVIAGIWRDVLGVSEVGVNDNFFQLGGHSLFAIQIAAQLREKFQVELEMRKMLEHPTVAALAELVEIACRQSESELDAIMTVLNEITQLSPDEVREQLVQASAQSSAAVK